MRVLSVAFFSTLFLKTHHLIKLYHLSHVLLMWIPLAVEFLHWKRSFLRLILLFPLRASRPWVLLVVIRQLWISLQYLSSWFKTLENWQWLFILLNAPAIWVWIVPYDACHRIFCIKGASRKWIDRSLSFLRGVLIFTELEPLNAGTAQWGCLRGNSESWDPTLSDPISWFNI